MTKCREMEGEISERVMKGRIVIGGALGRVMNRKSVPMQVKFGLRNSIFLPTLTCIWETWM